MNMEKKGIPKEIIEELDIKKKVEKKPFLIKAIVEHHQTRLTVPKNIVLDMNLNPEKENVFEVTYNKKNKEIKYKLK
jgi:hypothetical protein